ncbi:MAG: DUF4958 family protein [Alistipes sp.]
MNKKISLWNLFFTVLITTLTFGLSSCKDDDTENNLQLYYASVSDIGPSMNFTSDAPSYHGAAPSAFAIASLTLDGTPLESPSFTINAETGAISIQNTNDLSIGCYRISVSCTAGGATYTFVDAFAVQMLPATPVEIEVSPSLLELPYAEVATSKQTAQVTLKGESVSVVSYGLSQETGKEYFSITNKGVIGVNPNFKGDILPGVYDLDLVIKTYAGIATYQKIMQIKVISAPLELTYPIMGRMEYNLPFTGNAPLLKGSPEEVVFAIKTVTPQTDRIVIDPATGVLSVAENSALPIDSSYQVDVTVTNKYGSADFAAAYQLDVVAFIAPIDPAKFGYDKPEPAIQGTAFSVSKRDGFVGDGASFELVELPAACVGQLTIDAQTGAIAAVKGNTIPLGQHTIKVHAVNTKNEATTTFVLEIIENPNMFTFFSYGNNLGLDDKTNANQFRYDATQGADVVVTVPVASSDFKGRAVTFSMEKTGTNPFRTASSALSIDKETGELLVTFRNDRNGQIGVLRITATIGKGDAAVSQTIPVFFTVAADKTILYTPFVFRVNPRSGGRSEAPTLAAGVNPSQFLISLKRNVDYYNFDGPASHESGRLKNTATTTFIYQIWALYFGDVVNAASREPMSYYQTASADPEVNLAAKLGYIDGGDQFRMVINPNKWLDSQNQPANGVLTFQAPYTTNGDIKVVDASGTKTFVYPVAVWFDEKF